MKNMVYKEYVSEYDIGQGLRVRDQGLGTSR